MNGDHIHGREVEDDFFTGFDLQLLAENGEQVGGVTNGVDEFASQVMQALWFVDAGNFSSVTEDAGGKQSRNNGLAHVAKSEESNFQAAPLSRSENCRANLVERRHDFQNFITAE